MPDLGIFAFATESGPIQVMEYTLRDARKRARDAGYTLRPGYLVTGMDKADPRRARGPHVMQEAPDGT